MQKLGISLISFFANTCFIAFVTSGCASLKTADYHGSSYKNPSYRNPAVQNSTSSSANSSEVEFSLDWPVAEVKINRGFSYHPKHEGLDLGGKINSPIYASHSGRVLYANKEFTGYGRLIIIENQNGWASFYGHLNKILVKEGTFVKRGQEIAKMGKSGHATGVHLHFELRNSEKPVDPQKYLP